MLLWLCVLALVAAVLVMVHRRPIEGMITYATQKATLTTYESYPTTHKECNEFSGCEWKGWFAAYNKKKSLDWVVARNIAAVHSDDFKEYKNRWIRIKYRNKYIDCKVIDMCKDSDTDSGKECSTNRDYRGSGFLIDLESFTAKRLGFKGMDVVKFWVIPKSVVRYLYGSQKPEDY